MEKVNYKCLNKIVDKISDLIGYHELDFKTLDTSIDHGNDAAECYGYMPEGMYVDIVVKHYVDNRQLYEL